MLKIGSLEFQQSKFMAPLAGITDSAFRIILKEMGCDYSFTEMVSAKGLYYKDPKTRELTDIDPREGYVGIQIFGSDPEIIKKVILNDLNHRENILSIDLNMGCPAPKIVKNGDGSALMRKPDLARKLISTMVENSIKPVSVKFRLGWDEDEINYLEIGKICEEEGVTFVTLHPRTRKAFYSGKADWNAIKNLKEYLKIPVVGNGDIFKAGDAEKMFKETNCDALSIARGALENPNLFGDGRVMTLEEKVNLLKKHYQLKIKQKGERRSIQEMRKHVAWYLKGFPNSNPIKNKINTENNLDQIMYLLDCYLKEQESNNV